MTQPNDKPIQLEVPNQASHVCQNLLEETLRKGAQRLLNEAIKEEVEQYIQAHAQCRDESDRRLVVRNGHLPERSLQSGLRPDRGEGAPGA